MISSKHIIGHFPTPYPDELFFSICARYGNRVQYASKNAVCTELFGRRGTAAIIDLPKHIAYFTAKLPQGHLLTAHRLIHHHTLLPFHSLFLTAERVERLTNSMVHPEIISAHSTARSSRVTYTLNFLRFCPQCVAEDEKLYGECYWHRSHQIPGINVCYRHALFLENSAVHACYKNKSSLYISAAQAKVLTEPHPIDSSNLDHLTLLALANDAFWLLGEGGIVIGYEALRRGYIELLKTHGLVLGTGNVNVSELQNALRERYSTSLLNDLQSNFEENKPSNWPSRFVKNLTIGKPHPPQKHLLIIRLFGHSAESFSAFCMKNMSRPLNDFKPFGNGPWPCLNPVCKNFRKLVIKSCTIRTRSYNNYAQHGTFACRCGFIYTRVRRDQHSKDHFRYLCVKNYGDVWKDMLINLWGDTSISLRQMASKLGVDVQTIKFQAGLLRLQFPRIGPSKMVVRATPTLRNRLIRYQRNKSEEVDLKRRTAHRRTWLQNLKKHPQASRKDLMRLSPGPNSWLFVHDREWLHQNQPTLRKRGSAQADWSGLDIQFADQVRLSAQRIKNLPGRPVRVTKACIVFDIRDQGDLAKFNWQKLRKFNLKRLPLTAQAFEAFTEQLIDYYLRKIEWAANCFRQKGVVPSLTSLSKRAAIKWGKWYLPEVNAALQAVLASFQISSEANVKAA
jgi:hypothetical protein